MRGGATIIWVWPLTVLVALLSGCATPHFVGQEEDPLLEVAFIGIAPDAELEREARKIVRRDYWRLRTLLGSREPAKAFRIEFHEMIWRPRDGPVMGYAGGDTIRLSVSKLRRQEKPMAVVLRHEMTHLLQPYKEGAPLHWREGIAEFAARNLDADDAKNCRCTRESPTYLKGYECAAALLVFIEDCYVDGFARTLHDALISGEDSEALFERMTGKSVATLWEEFGRTERFDAEARARLAMEEAVSQKAGDSAEVARLTRQFIADTPGGKQIIEAGDHVFALAERGALPGYKGGRPRSLVLDWYNFSKGESYPREQEIRFPDERQRYLYCYKLSQDSAGTEWRVVEAKKVNYKTGRVARKFETLPATGDKGR